MKTSMAIISSDACYGLSNHRSELTKRSDLRLEFHPKDEGETFYICKITKGHSVYSDFFRIIPGYWRESKFYYTGGVYSSQNFSEKILSAFEYGVNVTNDTVIGYMNPQKDFTDMKIREILPEGYVFEDRYTFLACLGFLIKKQLNGEEGVLLNTGYRRNLFYVRGSKGEILVVSVHYRVEDNHWRCYAEEFGGELAPYDMGGCKKYYPPRTVRNWPVRRHGGICRVFSEALI